MSGVINTNENRCTGCNRCVRECPMDIANITYQDALGDVKVKVDSDKCICCGVCIGACRHNARYFTDDTERFFEDLSKGVKISLIAAPSIRTNLPMWKRLFTYLKQAGVDKIYDAALGADICIWSHIKHFEINPESRLITQPCPVIVNYLEMYQPEILKYLSPVHSPMACTAIYMMDYENIDTPIAALSPCIAKSDEFRETGLCQYNVTFVNIREYLLKKHIKLPTEETGFDHYDSGLGVLFPLPGGLKENIAYFMDNKVSLDTSEGVSVFKSLNIYSETPENILPQIFDVLNCAEGCNIGTACSYSPNIFEVNRTLDKCRNHVKQEREKSYFDKIHKQYDEKLDINKFKRVYKPKVVKYPPITDFDIERAFKQLGKHDFTAQNIDCYACGNETCYHMARKVAMKVNIPLNCIIKSIQEVKVLNQD